MSEPKTISRDVYLKALGLFALANEHERKCREFQLACGQLLGLEDASHVDDIIYSDVNATVKDFDEALKRENITVEAGE